VPDRLWLTSRGWLAGPASSSLPSSDAALYRVRRHGTDYALKVLHPHLVDGERRAGAFCREAALLGRVNDPGVPRVLDVGVSNSRPYLVMEFLDGRSLAEVVEMSELAEEQLVLLATDVAAAPAGQRRSNDGENLATRTLRATHGGPTTGGRRPTMPAGYRICSR
jgi:serine/threonine protein kinase